MTRHDGAAGGRRKGRRGFAPAAQAAAPLYKGAGAKRGFAEHRLISDWAAIMGPALAPLCRPVRMSFRRDEAAYGATLVVAAEGARAVEAQHMADVIVERVNAAYGYRAVARLKVVQSASAPEAVAENAAPFEGPPRLDAVPSPDICAVEDTGLRDALARLEANIRRKRDASAPAARGDRL